MYEIYPKKEKETPLQLTKKLRERERIHRNIPGIGKSGLVNGKPILFLFRPDAIILEGFGNEPVGSISHGETLPWRFTSTSSHLTCYRM